MNVAKFSQSIVWALACLGLIFPSGVFAEQISGNSGQTEQRQWAKVPTTIDVSLDTSGGLRGSLVDSQGQPLPATTMTLTGADGSQSVVVTSPKGEFHVPRVRGGMHMAEVADAKYMLRVWTPGTAPPSSAANVMMVYPGQTVAAQYVPMKCLFNCPTFLALVGGAAIAIPVAIHNHRQDRGSGS